MRLRMQPKGCRLDHNGFREVTLPSHPHASFFCSLLISMLLHDLRCARAHDEAGCR